MAKGNVIVGGSDYCAVEWRLNGTLDTTDADNIDVTTWCSSAREFIEAEAGFREATIEVEFDALDCYSFTQGNAYAIQLQAGDPLTTMYDLASCIYLGQTASNPVDGRFDATYSFSKKFSV